MIGVGVDEFRADDELISTLPDAPCDYTIDFQVMGDHLRINIMPLVSKNSRAGHDGEIWNLAKVVDQAFGEAVTEVFAVGIVCGVDEG